MADEEQTEDVATEPTGDDAAAESNATDEQTEETEDTGDAAKNPELARARKEAAKYRTDLRKVQKELADARAASLSDAERAIAEAKAAGAAEATSAMNLKLVGAELRAVQVPREVIDDLNLAKFIGEDGEIDSDAIAAAGKKYAPKPGAVDLKQGIRGNNAPSLDQQIADAKKAGDVMAVIRLENSRLSPAG